MSTATADPGSALAAWQSALGTYQTIEDAGSRNRFLSEAWEARSREAAAPEIAARNKELRARIAEAKGTGKSPGVVFIAYEHSYDGPPDGFWERLIATNEEARDAVVGLALAGFLPKFKHERIWSDDSRYPYSTTGWHGHFENTFVNACYIYA